jgi:hypothetical protein
VSPVVVEALFKVRTGPAPVRFLKRDVWPELVLRLRAACAAFLEPDARRPGCGVGGPGTTDGRAPGYREIFLLLGLIYPPEEIAQALQNYTEGTKRAVDYALELLENVLPKDVKDLVLPLLEDAPPEEKARTCRRIRRSLG